MRCGPTLTVPRRRSAVADRGGEASSHRRTPTTDWRRCYALAERHDGGVVDLSVGTPCDPPPPPVLDALASSRHRAVLPAVGRHACVPRGRRKLVRPSFRRGRSSRPTSLHASGPRSWSQDCRTGSVCGTRHATRCCTPRSATRPTPWARCWRAVVRCRSRSTSSGASICRRIDPADAARALLLWSNTPGNPAGGLDDLARWPTGVDVTPCRCSPTSATPSSPGRALPDQPAPRRDDPLVGPRGGGRGPLLVEAPHHRDARRAQGRHALHRRGDGGQDYPADGRQGSMVVPQRRSRNHDAAAGSAKSFRRQRC